MPEYVRTLTALLFLIVKVQFTVVASVKVALNVVVSWNPTLAFGENTLTDVVNAVAVGAMLSTFALVVSPMIVVFPDSKTVHNGSMYSNSVTTGHFEDYIWRDVVSYIDEHYRTLPDRDNRGLVGHSMGGYGASRIGMKHPDVFGSLYVMSPCCM